MALPSIHGLFGVRKVNRQKSSRNNRLQTNRGLLVEPLEERRLLSATVVDRFLFYSGSTRYDLSGGMNGQTPLAFSDDNAIATDKSAYLPGDVATFANVSSYSQGIAGIMVDLLGTGDHSSITASDFTFKVGNNNTPATWTDAPALTGVTVRSGMTPAANGAGTTSGSDRVELIWPTGAITQKWLEVTVKANTNTGLSTPDEFFFGSEIGDANKSNTAQVFKVTAADTTNTQTHLATLGTNQPITNVFDYNRDGTVGASDITIDQTHTTTNSTGLVVLHAPPVIGNFSFGESATKNLVVHFDVVDGTLTTPYAVNLVGTDPNGNAVTLVSHSVSSGGPLTPGSYTVEFDTSDAIAGEGQPNLALSVSITQSTTILASAPYVGAFEDPNGIIEVSGTSGADTLTESLDSGTLTLTLSGNAHTYSAAGATAVYIRTYGGGDSITLAPIVNLPQSAFAASGSLTVSGTSSTISDSYTAATDTAALTIDGATISATGFAGFDLVTGSASFANLSLGQYYDVTASDIDLSGSIATPAGFTPSADTLTLISNRSSATVHGMFANGNVSPPEAFYGGSPPPGSPFVFGTTTYFADYADDVTLQEVNHSGGVQVTDSRIITDEDIVPRFVSGWLAPESTNLDKSLSTGNWSDGTIWSKGSPPGAGDLVRISAGTTVTYDENDGSTEIKAIEIEPQGTLSYSTQMNTNLLVGTLEELPGGTLQIGTGAANDWDPDPTTGLPLYGATLTFADDAPDSTGIDPSQYGTGLLAFGTVTIHGSPIGSLARGAQGSTTWLPLLQEVTATPPATGGQPRADGELQVSTIPTGWKIGDDLVLPDTRQYEAGLNLQPNPSNPATPPVASELEVVAIRSITYDSTTTYYTIHTDPINFDHLGAHGVDPATGHQSATAVLMPDVALLNRNVTIESAVPAGYRGHTLFSGRANVNIENANFQNLGRSDDFGANVDGQYQGLNNTTYNIPDGPGDDPEEPVSVKHVGTNQVGRYAVHFHHMTGPQTSDTGYQFIFTGNTVQGSKKWAVAVHDTDYGLLQNNVVYGAQGAGFVTEDGSEIGNQFLDNMTVGMQGTYLDGNSGIDPDGISANNDYGRGGVGFWFRRAGNVVSGNVAADSSFAGMVITSYYLNTVTLPNGPGDDKDQPNEGRTADLNPFNPGVRQNPLDLDSQPYSDDQVFADNTIYGMSEFGLWTAYVLGQKNLIENPPTTFENLSIWNAAESAFVYVYHTNEVTFDNLTILGSQDALVRADTGPIGVTMIAYEDYNTVIQNSDIEGAYTGIATPPADASQPGLVSRPTKIENTTLRNYINIAVGSPLDDRPSSGNYVNVDDDIFTPYSLPIEGAPTGKNITMSFDNGTGVSNISQFSVVNVTNYNQVPGANFQVYYKEQAADATMETTNPSYSSRQVPSLIGAPVGQYLTNRQAWDQYGMASAGFLAPADANTTAHPEIDGLTSTTVVDPATLPLRVVLMTPFPGASYVAQSDNPSPYVYPRYNVQGLLNSANQGAVTGAAVWLELTHYDTDGITSLSVTKYDTTGPNDISTTGFDGIIWKMHATGSTGTLTPLVPGHYRLQAYVGDQNGNQVDSTLAAFTESTFDILPATTPLADVTLTPMPENAVSIGSQVGELLTQAGAQVLAPNGASSSMGMAITQLTTASNQGHWQYFAPTETNPVWTNLPDDLTSTNAFVLPPSTRVRFEVADGYVNAANDAPPELTYLTFDRAVSGIPDFTHTDPTAHSTNFSAGALHVTQPLLVTLSVSSEEHHRNSSFVFTISLASSVAQNLVVAFATFDGTATQDASHYVPTSGTLTFTAGGSLTQFVTVSVGSDSDLEEDEYFILELSDPSLSSPVVAVSFGTGTIDTDD